MKWPLLIVDVVAGVIGLWLIAQPSLIESTATRFIVFAASAAWLLFRWSKLAFDRSRVLLSPNASVGRKAEGYFLRVIVVFMAAIVLTIAVRFLAWR